MEHCRLDVGHLRPSFIASDLLSNNFILFWMGILDLIQNTGDLSKTFCKLYLWMSWIGGNFQLRIEHKKVNVPLLHPSLIPPIISDLSRAFSLDRAKEVSRSLLLFPYFLIQMSNYGRRPRRRLHWRWKRVFLLPINPFAFYTLVLRRVRSRVHLTRYSSWVFFLRFVSSVLQSVVPYVRERFLVIYFNKFQFALGKRKSCRRMRGVKKKKMYEKLSNGLYNM